MFLLSTDFIFCNHLLSLLFSFTVGIFLFCFVSCNPPLICHPAPQVSEIQKLDGQVKELVLKSSVEAERLVAGKLKKDTYIENEKMHSNKRQDLVSKIDNILDAL